MNMYYAKFKKALGIIRDDGMYAFLKFLKSKIINKIDGITIRMRNLIRPKPNKFRKLSLAQLIRSLQSRLQYDAFIVALSHTDYTKKVGGVELKILDEQLAANNNGLNYLHIYPRTLTPALVFSDEVFILGINLDGKAIGYVDGNLFIQALQTLSEKKLLEIRIHHTMGYSKPFVQKLLAEISGKRIRFWLHDFFSICPCYVLLRNNVEYCHAPEIDSNSCQICIYSETRRRQQEAFNQLFNDNSIEVVAPSDFALSLWKDRFPSKKYTSRVVPNADIVYTDRAQPVEKSGNILKIAFIGYPVAHKGWLVWLKLTKALKDDPRLQFYLFSSLRARGENFKQVRVSVTRQDRGKMVTALKEEQIDIAFLWSICPETFSFTLYESLAADCFVLTSKDSGNIQDYLIRNPSHGLVLKNEEELLDLFYTGGIFTHVSDYRRVDRPSAEIVFNEID